MADTRDLKSLDRKIVRVRVPPRAPSLPIRHIGSPPSHQPHLLPLSVALPRCTAILAVLMPNPVQNVMFDLGVVLLHLEYGDAQRACMAKCDPARLEAGGKFLRLLGRTPIVDAYERGDISARQFFTHFVEATGFSGSLDEFAAMWRSIFRENTPMLEFAHRVASRYPTFIMTNASDLHVPWVFDQLPSLNFFRDYAASCYVGAAKPEALYYERALQQFGVQAKTSLFIDDRPENVEAAESLGFRCVLYENPEQAIRESLKILDFP